VLVGSEEVEPGPGWPHAAILADLTKHPTMSGPELGTAIMHRYVESYQHGEETATQSAIDLGQLGELVHAVDTLARHLLADVGSAALAAAVLAARRRPLAFFEGLYVDLHDLAGLLARAAGHGRVAEACREVQRIVEGDGARSPIFAQAHAGAAMAAARGLSIYFPLFLDRATFVFQPDRLCLALLLPPGPQDGLAVEQIPYQRTGRKLPEVLSPEEVAAIASSTRPAGAPRSPSTSPPIRCATPAPPTCWSRGRIFGRSSRCSATGVCAPPSGTRTSPPPTCRKPRAGGGSAGVGGKLSPGRAGPQTARVALSDGQIRRTRAARRAIGRRGRDGHRGHGGVDSFERAGCSQPARFASVDGLDSETPPISCDRRGGG
jgi:hypothetical protein